MVSKAVSLLCIYVALVVGWFVIVVYLIYNEVPDLFTDSIEGWKDDDREPVNEDDKLYNYERACRFLHDVFLHRKARSLSLASNTTGVTRYLIIEECSRCVNTMKDEEIPIECKGMTFVVSYSIFILVLFCLFVYLMTTVDPAPIVKPDSLRRHNADARTLTSAHSEKTKAAQTKFEKFLKSLKVPDKAEYGLAKADPVETLHSTLPNIIFPEPHSEVKNQNYVDSPVWPKECMTTGITPTLTTLYATNITNGDSTRVPLKGLRRSVDGVNEIHKMDTLGGAVILKIVNEDGQSRIEIKLGNSGAYDKRSRRYRSPHRARSNFTMTAGEHTEYDEVIKKTVIRIMPNDTIFVDEPEKLSDIQNELVSDILANNKTNEKEFNLDMEKENSSQTNFKLEIQADYDHNVLKALNITNNSTLDEHLYKIKVLFNNDTKSNELNSDNF